MVLDQRCQAADIRTLYWPTTHWPAYICKVLPDPRSVYKYYFESWIILFLLFFFYLSCIMVCHTVTKIFDVIENHECWVQNRPYLKNMRKKYVSEHYASLEVIFFWQFWSIIYVKTLENCQQKIASKDAPCSSETYIFILDLLMFLRYGRSCTQHSWFSITSNI